MRGARGRERGPGGRTGGPLLVTGGRRRPPGERGDQGWWDHETASTLGKRRRRWGTIMVHSCHGPSHDPSPRRCTGSHAGCRMTRGTLAPGATSTPLSPGQRLLLPGCYAPTPPCGNPPQYNLQWSSGGSSWLEGRKSEAGKQPAARTRLSTEIGQHTKLTLLRTSFLQCKRIGSVLIFQQRALRIKL